MKTKKPGNMSPLFFIRRTLLILLGGLSIICKAQSIEGKWQGMSYTYYYSKAGADKYGKSSQTTSLADIGTVIIEYISDHTFITTNQVFNSTVVNTLKGTWQLKGDQLTITAGPEYHTRKGHESKTSTIILSANKLIVVENGPPGNAITKMETTYQKM
jgi:Lipocalin-like domain